MMSGWACQTRTLLSPSFSCDGEWKSRLTEPTLSKVNTDVLLSQLFIQFEKNKAVTAVDLEVFANKIQDVHPTQLHLVDSLLKRFRRCSQGISVIDSMSHAVIRGYIELKQAASLMPMLQQKIDYGVFPDDFAFCLLLDHFIKAGNLSDAAKIAIEMMIQEDMSHPTARSLALYATASYLEECKESLLAPFTEDDKPTLDEEEEEEYVVTPFIPLYNFDDHFDITDEKRLIGRTLDLISSHGDDPVYQSYKLIGLAMHENFDKLYAILENYLGNTESSTSFHKEVLDVLSLCVDACKTKTETIVRDPGCGLKEDSEYNARHTVEDKERFTNKYTELKPQLESSLSLLDTSLLTDTKELVKKVIEVRQETDIQDYKSQMKIWVKQRAENVKLQERAFQLKERQESLERKVKELTEKEELLNYFERQNDISLALLRAGKRQEDEEEADLTEYVAEPGRRGKKGKLGN